MTDNLKNKLAALALSFTLVWPQGLGWAAEAAMLEGIEVQPDQVTLTLSEQVRYTTFVTVDPPRLVVELADTEFASASKMEAGKGELLERVRAGQYQREPSLITRVVFDLKRLTAYKASWAGNRLQLRLAEGPFEESTDPQRAAQAPEAEDPEAAAVAKAAVPVAAPAVAAAPAEPAAVLVEVEDSQPEAPKKPAAKLVAKAVDSMRDAAKPKVDESLSMSTENSSELAEIAQAGDTNPSAAPKGEKKKTAKVATMKDTGMRRDIIATLPTEPITLDFDNMDIGDIMKLLATKAKINIVYGSDVAGMVSLHLVGVPFNEAFMTILSMQGLVANQVGENILRVMTPEILSKERATSVNQTRVIRLKYAKAEEIVTAVTAVRAAEKRTGGVVVDANTNSLVITDTLDGIASVERLLSQLDVRPQQVLIEAKLVEVNLTKDLAHGVQWDYFSNETSKLAGQQGRNLIGSIAAPSAAGGTKPFDQNTTAVGAGTGGFPGAAGRGTGVALPAQKIFGAFTWGRVANNYFLNATLTAAASSGKVKVLSDPKITTLNGKPAEIAITTSFPYVTSTVASTGVTTEAVAYTVTGITLKVTPTVNADGRITLNVEPNVSQPAASGSTAGTTGAISTDTRQAKTVVIVQDGETIVIGGLISDRVNTQTAKIPILGDIPVLGWLFKKKFVERTRVELLIFVTTKILES